MKIDKMMWHNLNALEKHHEWANKGITAEKFLFRQRYVYITPAKLTNGSLLLKIYTFAKCKLFDFFVALRIFSKDAHRIQTRLMEAKMFAVSYARKYEIKLSDKIAAVEKKIYSLKQQQGNLKQTCLTLHLQKETVAYDCSIANQKLQNAKMEHDQLTSLTSQLQQSLEADKNNIKAQQQKLQDIDKLINSKESLHQEAVLIQAKTAQLKKDLIDVENELASKQDALKKDFERGKIEGYANGYSQGKAQGYHQGEQNGVNKGYAHGFAQGISSGRWL